MHQAARPGDSLSSRLAALTLAVARRPLADDATEAARRLLQHAFGVCAASSALPVSASARQAIGAADGACLVFGSAGTHAAQDAAFANGATGHASLLEDSGPGGMACGSHPGCYVFPAALAAAQERDASGMDLVHATCAAYEAVDRLGALLGTSATGFRAVPLLGPFGAVAAAGALHGLSQAQLAVAYGIATNLAGGLNQGFLDGTMEPYLHAAFSARNGLMAVRMAQAGATASPLALEGSRGFLASFAASPRAQGIDVDHLLRPPEAGEALAISRVGAKTFATCLYNQGTLALVARRFPAGFVARDVAGVRLARPSSGVHGLHAPGVADLPLHANALQLQMSARFTTAAALLGRPVDSATWYQQAPQDAEALALARAIELVTHDKPGIRLEVSLRDGSHAAAQADGASALVFSSADVALAFERRARPVLGVATQEAARLLAGLPQLASLQHLTSLFRGAGDRPRTELPTHPTRTAA